MFVWDAYKDILKTTKWLKDIHNRSQFDKYKYTSFSYLLLRLRLCYPSYADQQKYAEKTP